MERLPEVLGRCESCVKRDIFILKPRDSSDRKEACECIVSEDRGCRILDKLIKRWTKDPPKAWSSPTAILTLLSIGSWADEFIIGRDLDIEKHVVQAMGYLFGAKKIGKWDYLDIGCGTFIPTMKIAKRLDAFPLGVDYADRRKCDPEELYFGLIEDGKIPSYGVDQFRFVTVCDILHHSPNPEELVLQALKMVASGGYMLIMDLNCESWEDSYYLDLVHLAYARCVGERSGDYLPVFGYRSRKYWRRFMSELGLEIVYYNSGDSYKEYVDVYRKK